MKTLLKVISALRIIRVIGLWQGLKLLFVSKYTRKKIKLNVDKYEFPITIRGSTSDSYVFNHNIVCKEYEGFVSFMPTTILDCGANIGLASLYWHMTFPRAEIIAVEPDSDNFDLLTINTSEIRQIRCLYGGIWPKRTRLYVSNPGSDKYAVRVDEDELGGTIEAYSIDSIMLAYGWSHIDVLKLDIEGSELQLLSKNFQTWIDKVNVVIIELHQDFAPNVASVLFAAFANKSFSLKWRGENLVLTRFPLIV